MAASFARGERPRRRVDSRDVIASRPRVLLSAAMSVDGYIDDASPRRLMLSSPRDYAAVRELRTTVDAVMVGAGTVRADNPRLLAERPPHPLKVLWTASGRLDPDAAVFDSQTTLVLCHPDTAAAARTRLEGRAEVLAVASLDAALRALSARGVRHMIVEGGAAVHTAFLTAGYADSMRLAVAPLFVGDPRAPRFAGTGHFPHHSGHRMLLERVEQLGDTAVMHYRLEDAGER